MTRGPAATAVIGLILMAAGCGGTPSPGDPVALPAATTPVTSGPGAAARSCPSKQQYADVLNTSIQMLEGMTSVEVTGDVACVDGWAVAPTRVHFGNNQVAAQEYRYVLRDTGRTWELESGILPGLCPQLPSGLAAIACAGIE